VTTKMTHDSNFKNKNITKLFRIVSYLYFYLLTTILLISQEKTLEMLVRLSKIWQSGLNL